MPEMQTFRDHESYYAVLAHEATHATRHERPASGLGPQAYCRRQFMRCEKTVLGKLQARKRAAENRIELKRRLLAHTLQQIGLKTLRTPTSTLTIADASLKAIPVAPEDIPARWWKPQPPKLDQDGLTKAIRAREKALKEAEAIPDPQERGRARAAVETLHPVIPGVTASNSGITLVRRV
jgi:hypothetical protein